MKIYYALEMLQTQGVNTFLNYFSRMGKEALTKNSTKASRKIVADPDVLEAVSHAKTIDVEHPKVKEISKIVENQFDIKPDSKIIVFTHFRNTSAYICNSLENVTKAKPARFIGQAIKEGDKGLTQKEQARIIDQFKKGDVNVLIATSVAEEGLDIPATDLVVFYEPIPSEIRAIQRRGRTGRMTSGKVIILITKGTSDVGYYWAAKRKEKRMRSELEILRSKLKKKFEDPQAFYRNEMGPQINQKTLTDYQHNKELVKIIVDHREYRSSVVKNLSTKGTDVEPQQLDIGDYVLSSRIGVERKNVDDYLDSLLSGKLFKQVVQLRNAYSRPILIIEGNDLYTKRNINHNAIFGSLASISVDYGVSILTTKDSSETADLLHVIAKREQREDKKAVAVRGDKPLMSIRERQQFIIEGLPNISAVIAKRLLSHFGSIKDIANASEEELQKVKGVGKNIALDIINLLNINYLED
jgi:Fanconi anemia group M protein